MKNNSLTPGTRVGFLTLVGAVSPPVRGKTTYWLAKCACGNVTCRSENMLKRAISRDTPSACVRGCVVRGGNSKTHRASDTRPYRVWTGMLQRVRGTSGEITTKKYSERGIGLEDLRWLKFENFWEDMQEGYSDALSLDRVDNNKGYSKSNCKWSTPTEQANNRRSTKLIELPGLGSKTLREWSTLSGIAYTTLFRRLKRGVPKEKILAPVGELAYTSTH